MDHFSLRQYADAITDFTRALELTPDSAWTRAYRGAARRGAAHYQSGQYDAALADLNRAIELDAFDPWPIYIRGLAKRKSGDAKGGDADVKAALAIWPDAAAGVATDGIQ